jgi:hypothetical protein
MKPFFDALREIRERPEMFVGQCVTKLQMLQRIELLMLGFELREAYDALANSNWSFNFRKFASKKEKVPGILVAGVVFALETKHHSDHEAIWNDFFRLVDEFEAEWEAEF